jgi:glycosyltransferase involved in cell wall biosynthesis
MNHLYDWPNARGKLCSLLNQTFDLVQVGESHVAHYLEYLPNSISVRTILDLHNLMSLQYRRMLKLNLSVLERMRYAADSFLARHYEPRICRRVNRCFVVSSEEEKHLRRLEARARPIVIENGVDTEILQPLPESSGSQLLFVGTMDYPPNIDAMMSFVKETFPLIQSKIPDVRLKIVGRDPTKEVQSLVSTHNVEVSGFVDDLVTQYRNTCVVVVPLRAGGGTRLKILEAMALGRAVVTTTLGAEGLSSEVKACMTVTDHPETFATSVTSLMRDDCHRRQLALSGRKVVEDQYGWSAIGKRVLQAYEELERTP